MEEMVEDVVVEEDVKEMDVFAEMRIVFAGFDALAHHRNEGLWLLEGDEFKEGVVDVCEMQFVDTP